MASTGATRKAADELVRLGLDPLPLVSLATPIGLDIATLKPRLLKDAALVATESMRKAALARAAETYEAVYIEAKQAGNAKAYYPGVNAATLNLLASNDETAFRLSAGSLAVEQVR